MVVWGWDTLRGPPVLSLPAAPAAPQATLLPLGFEARHLSLPWQVPQLPQDVWALTLRSGLQAFSLGSPAKPVLRADEQMVGRARLGGLAVWT